MIAKALTLLIFISSAGISVYSQTPAEVRIDPKQPTVYFTPERLAGDTLWLSLHNNSRWAISFRTERAVEITIAFRLADGRVVKTMIDGTEVSPEYVIINLMSGGHSAYWCTSSESWLAPGTSALIPVDVEKLKPFSEFDLTFGYEWGGDMNEPDHRVRFRYGPETKVADRKLAPGVEAKTD